MLGVTSRTFALEVAGSLVLSPMARTLAGGELSSLSFVSGVLFSSIFRFKMPLSVTPSAIFSFSLRPVIGTGPNFLDEQSMGSDKFRTIPRKRLREMDDRNPSPPRLSAEEIELIQCDNIGDTVFSKKWVLATLMKLIQSVQTNAEGSQDDFANDEQQREQQQSAREVEDFHSHDLDDDFERELCELWDMSMNAVSYLICKLKNTSNFCRSFQSCIY